MNPIFRNKKFKELFGIDIRSLALFRIGLAIVLLRDLIVRFQDITSHYSDAGLLPRDVLVEKVSHIWYVSLHLANGTPEFQFILFSIAGMLAVSLLLGYQTRIATILSWVLLISAQSRNPLILQGGDSVLRLLLFWAMFLPIGEYWSVDAWLGKKGNRPIQYYSVATMGLLLQVCFIYWFSAKLKTGDSWRVDGTAVWFALSLEQFSTPLGQKLLQYPNLLKFFTYSTLYLETFVPFLAFSPVWTGPLRMATVVIFMSFHLIGLNMTMELGDFVYVCAVSWLVFIPTWFWDKLFKPSEVSIVSNTHYSINILAAFCIACSFLWNVQTLGISLPYFTPQLQAVSVLLRLDQHWNMFSPFPIKEDGWYVIPAILRDGSEVDLFKNGQPVSWEKPVNISTMYKNDRWKAYMLNLLLTENNETILKHYAWHLCREWNSNHAVEKQLKTFEVVFMLRIVSLEDPKPPQKIVLWHHECFRNSLP